MSIFLKCLFIIIDTVFFVISDNKVVHLLAAFAILMFIISMILQMR